MAVGPDEELVNIREEKRYLAGPVRFLFPGLVELQQMDLKNSYLMFTVDPKLIIRLCTLVNSCLQLEDRGNSFPLSLHV